MTQLADLSQASRHQGAEAKPDDARRLACQLFEPIRSRGERVGPELRSARAFLVPGRRPGPGIVQPQRCEASRGQLIREPDQRAMRMGVLEAPGWADEDA